MHLHLVHNTVAFSTDNVNVVYQEQTKALFDLYRHATFTKNGYNV